MAGDWIPMRTNIRTDPAVIIVAEATGLDEYAVVGRLHELWSWANENTIDGHARGVTQTWIDRYIGVAGFADALCAAGWLEVADDGFRIPKFNVWNSQNAKSRLLAAQRQARHRVTVASRSSRDENVTREEKRIDKKNPPKPPAAGSVPIPDELRDPTFEAAWADWLADRRARRKALTARAAEAQLKKLAPLGPSRAAACVRRSIENGWTGLFPESLPPAGPPPAGRETLDQKFARILAERNGTHAG